MSLRNRHYQSELREVLRAVDPSGAADPDLELLFEAAAFLAGRVHERIDDAAVELYERLAELTRPHLIRLVPPAVVVHFATGAGARATRLPAGTELEAPTAAGTPCRFTTAAEVALQPLRILSVDAVGDQEAPTLRVILGATVPGGLTSLADAGLRLFVAAPPPLGAQIVLWALHHCIDVELRASGRLLQRLERPRRAALPIDSDGVVEATEQLQAYWALPQRLAFVDLGGFDRRGLAGIDTCELHLRCPGAPALPISPAPEDLRLACAPAQNLFEGDAAPIHADRVTGSYALRVDGLAPRHAEIVDLVDVCGVPLGRGGKRRYLPASAFVGAEVAAGAYTLRRSRSPEDGALDVELQIDAVDRPPREIIAAKVRATNRDLVAEIEPEQAWILRRGPADVRARPVTRISAPMRPPLGEAFCSRLAAHAALEVGSLASAERLRRYLQLYNFHPEDSLLGRRATEQIAAIRAVHAVPGLHVTRGGTIRCASVALTLDERGFQGRGDAYLFAHVLRDIFLDFTQINTALEFSARLIPSESELTWPLHLSTRVA